MEIVMSILGGYGIWIAAGFLALFAILIPYWLRVVVPTNEVHIVQTGSATVSYGKGQEAGNSYFAWPSWIPKIGITMTKFTLAVFDLDLNSYEAYDSGRLPFVVDVKAFFRISKPEAAAERVNSFPELREQLIGTLQGAVRSILAKNALEDILSERGTFGDQFTAELHDQLPEWGCTTVKNIEFMDIRDAQGSSVIADIMGKKKSLISMESRTEIANNNKQAEIAEITARQEAEIKRQEAEERIGIRTAEKDKEIGLANERMHQDVQEQAKITAERNMEVQKVNDVRASEIAKQVAEVNAAKDREVAIIRAEQDQKVKTVNAEADKKVVEVAAEAQLTQTTKIAEGIKITAENKAKGIEMEGSAEAEAARLMQMASVTAQIELAEKIGANPEYQKYLIEMRQVEANQAIGIEQAQALAEADIKIFANGTSGAEGLSNAGKLLSPTGGLNAGGALEAFAATPAGEALLKKFGVTVDQVKGMMGPDTSPAKATAAPRKPA